MEFDRWLLMDMAFNTGCVLGMVSAIFGVYQLAFNIFSKGTESLYNVWGAFIWIGVGLWLWQFFRFF